MAGLGGFFPDRPDRFQEALAAHASEACFLSYPGGQFVGYGEVIPISSDGVDVYVIRDGDDAIVVFRGSEMTWRDWFRNFASIGFPHQEQHIHAGFFQGILEVYDSIRDAVHGASRVGVYGHSQGGGLGVLCAKQLVRDHVKVHNVYTFGQPRIGDKVFCKKTRELLNERYFRVVLGNDPVPHAPMFFRFGMFPLLPSPRRLWHCGNYAFVAPNGDFAINPALCRKTDIHIQGCRDAGPLSFKHHFSARYASVCKGLHKCLEESYSSG